METEMRTFIVLGLIMMCGGLYATYKEHEACTAIGGTLVKGVVWYTCIGGKP